MTGRKLTTEERLVRLEGIVSDQEHEIRSLSLSSGVDEYYTNTTGLFQRALDHLTATDPHGRGSEACMVCRQRYPAGVLHGDMICPQCEAADARP